MQGRSRLLPWVKSLPRNAKRKHNRFKHFFAIRMFQNAATNWSHNSRFDTLRSLMRKSPGRATQDMDDATAEAFRNHMVPLLPDFNGEMPKTPEIKDQLVPCLFGIGPNSCKLYMEKGFLPCAKLTTRGTRKVVLADLIATCAALEAYYSGPGAPPAPNSGKFSPSMVVNFFKNASLDQLRRMRAKSPTWSLTFGTVGPQDPDRLSATSCVLATSCIHVEMLKGVQTDNHTHTLMLIQRLYLSMCQQWAVFWF